MMNIELVDSVRNELIALLSQGQLDEGAQLVKQCALHLPDAVRFECEGTIHFHRGSYQEAARCYEAAIGLAPDRIIARYQYLVGLQEEREGDLVAAFQRYQTAVDADRGFVDAFVRLGDLLVKVGDLGGATACLREAARLAPFDPRIHRKLDATA